MFFYSLGTGKYFPTYDKITTAAFDITFPSTFTLTDSLLDRVALGPALYTLTDTQLSMALTSAYGPFTRGLILVFVPEPAVTWLLGAGFLGWRP